MLRYSNTPSRSFATNPNALIVRKIFTTTSRILRFSGWDYGEEFKLVVTTEVVFQRLNRGKAGSGCRGGLQLFGIDKN
jgi:hypothetical protein